MGAYIPSCFEMYISYSEENYDSLKTISEYVIGYEYQIEIHKILTKDGYILTMFRIPGRLKEEVKEKQPILLMHGLFDSAFSFLIKSGPEKNLPFILSDQGYDVWLGNNRGNIFSTEHVNKSEFNYLDFTNKYWDFSFDEMSKYDLPAMIDYILEYTNFKKLLYFGHSQGCLLFSLLGCEHPYYLNERILKFVGFSPTLFLSNSQNAILRFSSFLRIPDIIRKLSIKNFFLIPVLNPIIAIICRMAPMIPYFCLQMLLGKTDNMNINLKRIGVLGKFLIGGTSTQNICHWFQNFREGKLRKYNYGFEGNLKKYNFKDCPEYNLSNLNKLKFNKMFLIGEKDSFLTKPDYEKVKKAFVPTTDIVVKDYGHADLIWADTAYLDLYPQIIDWIKYQESKEALEKLVDLDMTEGKFDKDNFEDNIKEAVYR